MQNKDTTNILYLQEKTGKSTWAVSRVSRFQGFHDLGESWFITSDDQYVEFNKDGSYAFYKAGNYSMPVRLVMD